MVGMSIAISPELKEKVQKAQLDEEYGAALYVFMAGREKNAENKRLLTQMAREERQHAAVWKGITGKDIKPGTLRLFWLKLLTVVLGFTFAVKTMQKNRALCPKRL